MDRLAEVYEVPCVGALGDSRENLEAVKVGVPGSKSITNRALLLATLGEGTSTLRGVLFSDDSRHFLSCIQELGFETEVDEGARVIRLIGHGGMVPQREASLYVGSAGTAARFLTAYLGVSRGLYHVDASAQMRRRPMAPLLASLEELGCEIRYPEKGTVGHLPFTLQGQGFCKHQITVNIDHSSQFLSALLIASCLSEEDFVVDVEGSHGMAYIQMTCQMMAQSGVHVEQPSATQFLTHSGQHYQALDYYVEPDVSAACYFYACVPLLHIPMLVEQVHFDSLQGDVAFIRIMEQLGCHATDTAEGILLTPPDTLSFPGITVDMSSCSDQAITLAAIAPFADSPTTITGIAHIRLQESDRIHGIVTELGKMGIRCEESADSITIYPGTPQPSVVETYEDHRMAMGFSLIGLRVPGIRIQDPACCRKTFEDYFTVLEKTIQEIQTMIK